jgi:hypothetical protein
VKKADIYLDPNGGTTFIRIEKEEVDFIYAYPYEFRYMEILAGDNSKYDGNMTQSFNIVD